MIYNRYALNDDNYNNNDDDNDGIRDNSNLLFYRYYSY